MIKTPSIYKDVASFASDSNIKTELAGIYITPTHIWATDSFRAVTVSYEQDITTPVVFIPRDIAKTLTGEFMLATDGASITNIKTGSSIVLAPTPDTNASFFERAFKHTQDMIPDVNDETNTNPRAKCNSMYLSSVLSFIAKHDSNRFHGVTITMPSTKWGGVITVVGDEIKAVVMSFNK